MANYGRDYVFWDRDYGAGRMDAGRRPGEGRYSRGGRAAGGRYGGSPTRPLGEWNGHHPPSHHFGRRGDHRGQFSGADYDEGFLDRVQEGWGDLKRGARRLFRDRYDRGW